MRPGPSLAERADYYDLGAAANQGRLLPAASAWALEQALLVNTEDLHTRARLLGYYHTKRGRTNAQREELATARWHHIMWFIQHAPECKFAGDIYFAKSPQDDHGRYTRAKAAWSEQMAARPNDRQVAINAALLAIEVEPAYAVRLLKNILKLDPGNTWAHHVLWKIGRQPRKKIPALKVPVAPPGDFDQLKQVAAATKLDTDTKHGEEMPPQSAGTIAKVVAKHPDDLAARALLAGYYYRRWKRANVLGYDPECLSSLLEQILWFIEYLPGAEFCGSWYGFGNIDRTIATDEHALVADAWLNKIKGTSDPAVLANAAIFFAKSGQMTRARPLADRARKLSKGDRSIARILELGLYRARPRKPAVSTTQARALLDAIAEPVESPPVVHAFGDYTLAEWAAELDLSGANLAGSYEWVPAGTIANMEEELSDDSTDMFSRALAIGYYTRGARQSVVDDELPAYVRHISWFIDNVPECRYVSRFKLNYVAEEAKRALEMAERNLATDAGENPDCTDVIINIAAALARVDKKESKRLARLLLKRRPEWAARILNLIGEPVADFDAKATLERFGFRAGQRSNKFSKIARSIDLQRHNPFLDSISKRTLWSNERALSHNPNDLVLRAELVQAYEVFDQYDVYFGGATPDVVEYLVEHNLWFIHHMPDNDLSSLELTLDFHRNGKHLGHHAPLFEAAKQQIRAYPKSLDVTLSMIGHFPFGYERQKVVALERVQKRYPNNKILQGRLSHYRSLLRFRKDFS